MRLSPTCCPRKMVANPVTFRMCWTKRTRASSNCPELGLGVPRVNVAPCKKSELEILQVESWLQKLMCKPFFVFRAWVTSALVKRRRQLRAWQDLKLKSSPPNTTEYSGNALASKQSPMKSSFPCSDKPQLWTTLQWQQLCRGKPQSRGVGQACAEAPGRRHRPDP